MHKLLPRRPSPALLVAIAALVASLAGTAFADEVARMAGHVTSKHIKNGSVTGADVRNESLSSPDLRNGGVFSADIGTGQVQTPDLGDDAVRGDKIQANTIDGSDIIDDALGGREIDEDTLARVPRAAKADDAATLGGLGPDDFVRKGEGGDGAPGGGAPTGYLARFFGDGEQVTLAEAGGLRIYATCRIEPAGGIDRVQVFIDSTTDNAAYDDNNGPEDSDFDASEGPEELYTESADDDANVEVTNYGSGVTGVATDGSVVAFNDYAMGVNLAGRDDTCFVAGTAVVASTS